MARGITIPVTLNPRDFIRGIKQVETGLDGLQKDLKQVEKAGDGLGDGLQDEARQAERAFERFGRDVKDELDDIERRARDVDIAGNVRGGTKGKIGSVGAEVADEFSENFGEAMRSGNPADAVLETFTSLGPALGALGIGAALVAGIINQVRAESARVREALIGSIAGPADQTMEEQGYSSGQQFVAGLNRALGEEGARRAALQDYFGTDSFVEALTMAQDKAKTLGIDMLQLEGIVAGTTWQTEATVAALEQQAAILQGQINTAYAEAEGSLDNMTLAQQQQVSAWVAQRDGINDLIAAGVVRLGQVAEEKSAVNELYLEQVAVTEAARDAAAAARGGAAAAWDTAAGWAATRDRIRESVSALARAKQEALGIPTSVTVNVINKLSGADLNGDGLPR